MSVDFYVMFIKNGCCFIFNFGKNGIKVCSIRWVGVLGGLSVILDV